MPVTKTLYLNEMTRDDFEKIPYWDYANGMPPVFDCIVIIPGTTIHDSGYRDLDFVGFNQKENIAYRLAGGSDVLAIEGVGGSEFRPNGFSKEFGPMPSMVAWGVDCLAASGYMRLFNRQGIRGDYYPSSAYEIRSVDAIREIPYSLAKESSFAAEVRQPEDKPTALETTALRLLGKDEAE